MILGSVWGQFGYLWVTLGSLGSHFWHSMAALGHFGITLGALAVYGGDFEVILGSDWGLFGYLWVTLGHLMVTLQ